MKSTTLYETLLEHQAKGYAPFHTPGHKNSGFFPPELLRLDLTELPDTDALFEASGVIARTEQALSALFGSGCSLISAGGCTLAIQTMLALACLRGRKIILGRNAHRSAVNTAALLGFEPVWLLPEGNEGCFTGRVTPQAVEDALTVHPDAAAVYLTSPTYYGELSDIPAIAPICHRHGALLLIDNAHGSHLAFLQQDLHPLHLGADMTACSLHKTLPVLTGGAALQLADGSLAAIAKQKMALFGSTSPSYLIMSSIDLCCRYLQDGGSAAYRDTEQRVRHLKALAAEHGLPQPAGSCDPLRVCFHTAGARLAGQEQTAYFHRHGIEPEFCDGQNAVMLCTPFNTEKDFRRLEQAIEGLSGRGTLPEAVPQSLPEAVMLPREAVLAPAEPVAVESAIGKIAAESACPCPPGIPVIMPGERIGEQEAALLRQGGISHIQCVIRHA